MTPAPGRRGPADYRPEGAAACPDCGAMVLSAAVIPVVVQEGATAGAPYGRVAVTPLGAEAPAECSAACGGEGVAGDLRP